MYLPRYLVVTWLVARETASARHTFCVIHHLTMHKIRYGTCTFSYKQPPALLVKRPGCFRHYCGNTGVEWILKSDSVLNVDPGKENYLAVPAGTRTCDLRIARSVL